MYDLGHEPYLPSKRKRGFQYDDDFDPPPSNGRGWFCAGVLTTLLAGLLLLVGILAVAGAPLLDWALGDNRLSQREAEVAIRETDISQRETEVSTAQIAVNSFLIDLSRTPLPSVTPLPTETPQPTPTLLPTNTPPPSGTPRPTATQTDEPTPTIEPTPTLVRFLDLVEVDLQECTETSARFTLDFEPQQDFVYLAVTIRVVGEPAAAITNVEMRGTADITKMIQFSAQPSGDVDFYVLEQTFESAQTKFQTEWQMLSQTKPINLFSIFWYDTSQQPDLDFVFETVFAAEGGVSLSYEGESSLGREQGTSIPICN